MATEMREMTSKYSIPIGEDYEVSDEKSLIGFCERWFHDGLSARHLFDVQATLNIAFFKSQQWVDVDKYDATILHGQQRDPNDEDSIMLTINKIVWQVERFNAKLLKSSPIPTGRPVSDEASDLKTAMVATRVMAHEYHRLRVSDVLLPRTYVWVTPAGHAFWHVYWDEDTKEIGKDFCPHNEVVFDPASRWYDPATTRWIIRTVALTPQECWERFGEVPEDAPSISTLNDTFAKLSTPRHEPLGRIAVRQLWIRPNAHRGLPKGCVLTWSGGTILDGPTPFPYDHERLPFVQFNALPPFDEPFGRTPVTDLIDMQIDYNATRSVEADIRRRLMPFMSAVEGGVDEDAINGMIQMITHKQWAAPPHFEIPNPAWMQNYEQTMNRNDAEMGQRTGQNDASMGNLAGTSPGVTALTLQEAAAEPMQGPARELAATLSEDGLQHVQLVRQFWPEKRIIKTWSELGRPIVNYFTAADLKGELDVRVSTESGLPRSIAGRFNMLMEMHKASPEEVPFSRVIQLMDLPPTDVLASSYNSDAREAEWENDTMMNEGEKLKFKTDINGQPTQATLEKINKIMPPVFNWQNHAEHMRVHNDFRKSPEWRQGSDEVKALFDGHCAIHEEQILAEQQNMMNAAMAEKGGGIPTSSSNPGAEPPGDMAMPGGPGGQEVPPITELAGMTGGIAGEQGPVPGADQDLQAFLTGN